MRVLFVAPNDYPHIGSVERHVREVSRELGKDYLEMMQSTS